MHWSLQPSGALCLGRLPPRAFFLHTSSRDAAHVVVRLCEACARAHIGRVGGANLIKLLRETPKVSFLSYPDLYEQAHPVLERSVQLSLQTFRLRVDRYDERDNPPILHRKELFVLPD
jgi:DNA phosphorothioation-associated putative methyltransferase